MKMRSARWFLSHLILLFCYVGYSYLLDIYCGNMNCYQTLGVENDASGGELAEALSQVVESPHSNKEMITDAKRAYQILINKEARMDYDKMLKNPHDFVNNYYKYFKHRLLPAMNIQYLVVTSIMIISLIQYFYKKHKYTTAVLSAMRNPKLRSQALHKIQEERLLEGNFRKLTYWEEEKFLRRIVEDTIIKGKYRKAKVSDTLFIQILFAPYYSYLHMKTHAKRLDLFQEEYEAMPSYVKLKKLDKNNDAFTPLTDDVTEGSNSTSSASPPEADSTSRTKQWLNNNNFLNGKEDLGNGSIGSDVIKKRKSSKNKNSSNS